MSSSVGVARLRRTRDGRPHHSAHAERWLQPRFHSVSVTKSVKTCTKNGTNCSRFTTVSRPSRLTSFVSKTKNGTQDTLGTQKWYKLWPKMVNFGYGWPIMVSKGPVSLPFHGHLDSLRSPRWPKIVHNSCKKRTNYGQNNATFAKIKIKTMQLLHQILYSFWYIFSSFR